MAADALYMQLALAQARHASAAGEVPVGAVLVHQGEIIGTGHNAPIVGHDPTAHAEIRALRAAAQKLGNYRLEDCELYVTLEPCPMCAGAMLHARLKRVVYGATDPKTGAAGSVVNLFTQPQLNHHTQIEGGVLAEECSALLHEFFRERREVQKLVSQPVREDAVRTPEAAFAALLPPEVLSNYVSDLPSLGGLRMHYLDSGPHDAPITWLALHGHPGWSQQFAALLPHLRAAGHRVVTPDLMGYGRSDKPKKDAAHSLAFHRQVLREWVERLDLQRVVLLGQDWGSVLALHLPPAAPQRYLGLVGVDAAWPGAALPSRWQAWQERCVRKADGDLAEQRLDTGHPLEESERLMFEVPFVDRGHRAALRAFPRLLGEAFDAADSERSALQRYWREAWTGPVLLLARTEAALVDSAALQAQLRGCAAPGRGGECEGADAARHLAELVLRYFSAQAKQVP
jgi:tRNA(adenine34) deaminase